MIHHTEWTKNLLENVRNVIIHNGRAKIPYEEEEIIVVTEGLRPGYTAGELKKRRSVSLQP